MGETDNKTVGNGGKQFIITILFKTVSQNIQKNG